MAITPFKGKKAIVLGGTSGIGLEVSRQLRDAGCEVVAASRRGELPKSSKNENAKIKTEAVDILDRDGLAAMFKKVGKIDYLVCAATGGPRAIGPFMKMDLDGYQGSFAKLWGYTNAVQLGTKYVSKKGSICLVSGSPARKCGEGQIAISSVGGAVEAFTRGVAKEIAPIRVNVVSPGLIDTPMSPLKGKERKDFYKGKTAHLPVPRAGHADEVAAGVIFALSNEYMTGSTIDVDGGILLP